MRHLLLAAIALALCGLAGATARAQAREVPLQHTHSLGAFVAVGTEYSALVVNHCVFCGGGQSITGFDSVLDFGGTLAVGDSGSELALRGRLVFLSPAKGESVLLGYRKYFGKDEIKTFASFDLMGTFRPVLTGGARAAFGGMWDFSPIMGLWLEAGGSFGFGSGRRFGAELMLGFQGRTYLLE